MRMPPTGCAWWLVDDVADVAATEKAEAVGHRRRPAVANSSARAVLVAMEGMVSGEQWPAATRVALSGGWRGRRADAGKMGVYDQSTSYF